MLFNINNNQLYAKDLCIDSTSINQNLITIPDDYIPHKLNEKGLTLLHNINKDALDGKFKDSLYDIFIVYSNKCGVINKYSYGFRNSDNLSIKTGPILFSNLIVNGWIYTLNGSLYKIISFAS